MPTYRVRCVLPYTTNLPRDVAVNTFHVTRITALSGSELTAVMGEFANFYKAYSAPAGAPIGAWIGSTVSRVPNACRIEVYDLADTEPRPIIAQSTFTLPDPASGTNLPLEVAGVLSFRGTYPAGAVRARRRGRVFIGPLRTDAVNGVIAQPTLAAGFQTTMRTAAKNLHTGIPAAAPLAFWSIWSRKDNLPVEVIGGWTDDAPDTQRRRGQAATARTLWP